MVRPGPEMSLGSAFLGRFLGCALRALASTFCLAFSPHVPLPQPPVGAQTYSVAEPVAVVVRCVVGPPLQVVIVVHDVAVVVITVLELVPEAKDVDSTTVSLQDGTALPFVHSADDELLLFSEVDCEVGFEVGLLLVGFPLVGLPLVGLFPPVGLPPPPPPQLMTHGRPPPPPPPQPKRQPGFEPPPLVGLGAPGAAM